MDLILKKKQGEEASLLDFENDGQNLKTDSTYAPAGFDTEDDANCKMDSDLEMKFLIQAEEMDDEELRYYPNWRYHFCSTINALNSVQIR